MRAVEPTPGSDLTEGCRVTSGGTRVTSSFQCSLTVICPSRAYTSIWIGSSKTGLAQQSSGFSQARKQTIGKGVGIQSQLKVGSMEACKAYVREKGDAREIEGGRGSLRRGRLMDTSCHSQASCLHSQTKAVSLACLPCLGGSCATFEGRTVSEACLIKCHPPFVLPPHLQAVSRCKFLQ